MTRYIESKPNGDGTYDHTEVRAAYKQGCEVDIGLNGRYTSHPDPMFFSCYQYRASVPDTYGIHESSSTLREVKGDAGPAVAEMLLDRIKELEAENQRLKKTLKLIERAGMYIERRSQ